MPDFNPKDMDALFREGAERHEFEYNPDAWALMEEKLDKKQSKRRILFYLLGFSLLLAFFISYSYFDVNDKSEKETIAIIPQPNLKKKTQTETISTEKETVESVAEKASISKVVQDTKEEYISTDSKESSSNIGAQNSFQSENTGNLIGNEIVSIASQSENHLIEQHEQSNDIIYNNVELTSTTNINDFEANKEIEFLSIPSLKNRDFEMFDTRSFDLESIDLKAEQTTFAPILLASSSRFAATIFANPEWSSVGLFKESKAGWSVGTKFGFQFADKFEISAGVAFSRKIYKGAGAEYTMEGGWFNDIEPMIMDAKCDVIEIPLGLSYHFNGFRNNGFFVDLGINSYMLHSEWYGFDYEYALSIPERYKEVIEEDENSHLVGVGRFAIGYQKVLSDHTSVQIAPYLQFPLTGIGAGQVNLYSSGVQIAVKFNTQ